MEKKKKISAIRISRSSTRDGLSDAAMDATRGPSSGHAKTSISAVVDGTSSRIEDAASAVDESDKSTRISHLNDPRLDKSCPRPRSFSSTNAQEGGGGEGPGDERKGAEIGFGVVKRSVARSPSVTVANFIHCKLCLDDYPPREMVQLSNCRCLFCADCVMTWV